MRKEPGGWYWSSLGIQVRITEGWVRLAASDVANFLACRPLTQLDLLMARDELWNRPASTTSGSGIWSGAGRCRADRAGAIPRGRALRYAGQWGAERGRGDKGSHLAWAGVVYQRTLAGGGPGGGVVWAAGFPRPGRPAARVGRGAAAGPGSYEVVHAKLAPVRKGPRGAADRVLPASFRSRGLTGERADLLEVFNLDDEAASTLEVVNNALLGAIRTKIKDAGTDLRANRLPGLVAGARPIDVTSRACAGLIHD